MLDAGGGDVEVAGRTIGLCVVVRDRRGNALAASALDPLVVAFGGKIGDSGGVDGVCGRPAIAGCDPDVDAAGMPRMVPLAGASRSITDSATEFDGSTGSATDRADGTEAATSCSSITGGWGPAVTAAMLSSPTGRAHGERDDGRGRG